MKRIILILSLCALGIFALAAETVSLGAGQTSATVLSSNDLETIIQYQIGRFEKFSVEIDGEKWNTVYINPGAVTHDKGYPQLPVFNRSIVIDGRSTMKMEVYDVEYEDLDLPLAPSKGHLTRETNPEEVPYTFEKIYDVDEFYPREIASLSEPYILRDFRGIVVQTTPFAYNPVSRKLRVFTSFKIRIYADGRDTVNTLYSRPGKLLTSFRSIYENHFLNWDSQRYTMVDETFGKMLVICHSNYLSQAQPFVDWKIQKGIPTELIEFSTIGSTSSQLQTYIQNRYDADNEIAYIQLIGDLAHIPSPTSDGGEADPLYSLVSGSDHYPDIFIGRFSAESAMDVTTQVNKSIAYERDATTSDTWLSRAFGIGSSSGTGDDGEYDWEHIDNIKTDLVNYGYTTVDEIYYDSSTASQVSAAINAGRGFGNYCGHGSVTSWSTTGFNNTNVNALSNSGMTPFIFSVACVNGDFSSTCFAEAWVRKSGGGAVAFYGSSVNQPWDPPMIAQDETTDLLVAEEAHTIGSLFYNGSCQMLDESGSYYYYVFDTWHIFGDASLVARTKTPMPMAVSHPSNIVSGTTSLSVSTGVSNALVAITYDNEIYGRGFTDASGNLALNLTDPPTGVLDYTITATAHNRVTYAGTIAQTVASGPWMEVSGVDYSDSDDDTPEYSESGEFDVTFYNSGTQTATNVTATLDCSTPGITITDGSHIINSLAAGSSMLATGAFAISIADDIPNGTIADFTITMAGSSTWTHNFNLTIFAPELAFGAMTISDPTGDGDGLFDPGETVEISIPLLNNGGSPSPSGTATFDCSTTGVTVVNATDSFSPIGVSGSAILSFSASADPGVPEGTLAQFLFEAIAGAYLTDSVQELEVGIPPTVILGSGTSTTDGYDASPINIWYKSLHGQAVYTAAELNDAGIYGPINISQIGFYVESVPNLALPNFVVRMKHTSSTNVASWISSTDMITVYSAASYMPTAGDYDMLPLSTPFTWNGTDNIVIDTAFSPVSAYSSSGTTRYTSFSNGYRYIRNDNSDQTSVFSGGSTSSYRPNVKLALQNQQTGPSIAVNPSSVNVSAYQGETLDNSLTILNTGTDDLSWNTSASLSSWGTVEPVTGSISPGGNSELTITLDSSGLSAGTYTADLEITSNAANDPELTVPVSLTVLQSPYPMDPRFVAEWEPAQGALVRYPLGLPYPLLADLSNDGLLYVVVSSSNQSACNTALSGNGVNMANVNYINAETDTYWIRDYGPWTIFDSAQMKIVDFTYNRPRPDDDVIPTTVAGYLGLDHYDMDLTATGGNVMCDGHEAAMSTNLILEENPGLSQSGIDAMAHNYLGVTDYQFYTDPNNTYIDHIDCWGKLLDVDKVLIRSVPSSHAQYDEIEATVDEWEAKTSGYGTPYRIFRVYTPNNEPYTNSYIMNKRIYVPLMGTGNDSAALSTYESAMPGYTVTGYTHTNWESTDALHCRVNTVFDSQMIHVWHVPPTSATANATLQIDAEITHSNPLDTGQTHAAYRHSETGTWQEVPLTHVSGDIWTAQIPTPAYGETIYYYILATDTTARSVTSPLCGAYDPFTVTVDVQGGNSQTIHLDAGWNLVSTWLEPDDPDMLSVFAELISAGYLVKVQNEAGAAIAQDTQGAWQNGIGDLLSTEGYYVRVNAGCDLVISGTEIPLPLSVQLQTGWNIISYPHDTAQDALPLVQPLIDSGLLVKVQNEAGNAIAQDTQGVWQNNIGDFLPGEGYYIKVSGDAQMNFTGISKTYPKVRDIRGNRQP